jgi:long-chain acyl-CoA synthetase
MNPGHDFPPGALIHSAFEASAERLPAKTAIVCGEQRLSYAGLRAQVQGLAGALQGAGIGPGDRVLLFMDSGPEFAAAMFAVWRCGAVLVPVSALTKSPKLAWLLADTGASALLTQGPLAPAWQAALAQAGALRAVWVAGTAPADAPPSCRPWPEAAAEAPAAPAIDADALATLIYTSGTTGHPKGVMLSHANMRAAWRSVQAYLALREDDVIGLALPPAFSYGLYHLVMGLGLGATVVLERQAAFPARLLQRLAAERVTVFPGVPTLFAALLQQDLARHDLAALRILTNAAAPLPPVHQQRLREALPQACFFAMYGLTECKRASYLAPEDQDARPGSVGRGLPFQTHWLADEAGRPLPNGATGELVVCGEHVMLGYWRQPEDSARRLRPGPTPRERVLHTGDLFRSDADGYLYFVSRSDDIIKSRGEKVSPVEVEHTICQLPAVLEAAVVGVPDDALGQAVKAYVRLRPGAVLGERDVIRHCLAQLESFMAPKTVAFVDELPLTDSGKVRRASLQQASPIPTRATLP